MSTAPKSSRSASKPSLASAQGRWAVVGGIVAILAAVFVAYSPVWHAGFIWDDDVYVTDNPLLTAPDGLSRIWFSTHYQSQYFPLVYTCFRIQHALWGFNPLGYHLVNVLLHSANALLIWLLLRKLTVPAAWFAAAIFALHPVQVESVAWVTELKNTQSTFFYLVALWAWLRFCQSQGRRGWLLYVLTFGFYLLALLSKTTACTFPAAMILVLWLRRDAIDRRRLAQVAPFALAGLGLGILTVLWESHNFQEQTRFSFGPATRLLVASRALWFYGGKLFWPTHLSFSYPRWEINPLNPWQYLWLLAAIAMALLLWKARDRFGRGVLAGFVFFGAALSPLLGFFWLYTFHYSFVADHYQYLASIGLIAVFAAGVSRALRSLAAPTGVLLQISILVLLGSLTWRQAHAYHSPETLWRDTLAKNPESCMAQNNLGLLLARDGKLEEAIGHYQEALRVRPDFTDAAINLGVAYKLLGRRQEALEQFALALKVNPDDPDARNNIAVVLSSLGRYEEALAHLSALLKSNPKDATALFNAGNALAGLKRPQEAAAHYEAAIRLEPSNFGPHYRLAKVLLDKGEAERAIQEYRAAVACDPNVAEAHFQLATLLLARNQTAEGISHFQAAVRLKPDWVEPLNNLAWLFATQTNAHFRNGTEAVRLASRAVDLTAGKDPEALDTLAAAYAEAGHFADATTAAERGLALALEAKHTNLVHEITARLALYRANQAFRQ